MFSGRDGIEFVEQREKLLRLMRRIACDVLCRRQRVGGRRATRRRGSCEELVARVAVDPRNVARQYICQRIDCRQRRRLRTVERILNHRAEPARFEVHQVRHVASGDLQTKRVPFDRSVVDELRVRPHRGDGRHLVDHDAGYVRGEYRAWVIWITGRSGSGNDSGVQAEGLQSSTYLP